MATSLPFTPTTGATTGKTVTISTGADTNSVASTITNTGAPANNILVTNGNSVLVFVRITTEAAPTATTADVPLPAGASRVFMNPATNGVTGIAAVNVSGTAGKVYFTPGEGGI